MKKFLLTGFLLTTVILGGCEEMQTPNREAFNQQEKIEAAVPVPQITNSLERENVAKRAKLFSVENKISYIYLINYGRIMAFYTVKGKIASLRSYLIPVEKIVNQYGEPCRPSNSYCFTVEAPDIDGTYGENEAGIFFFTTDGAYVEWNGDYMMSDQPLQLTDKPALIREVK